MEPNKSSVKQFPRCAVIERQLEQAQELEPAELERVCGGRFAQCVPVAIYGAVVPDRDFSRVEA